MNKEANICLCCGKEFYSTEHMWWCDDCRKKRKEAQEKGETLVCMKDVK